MQLDQAPKGKYTVTHAPSETRLTRMGLMSGVEVEVLRRAPLGGPIELRLLDYRLCLRPSLARSITVEPKT